MNKAFQDAIKMFEKETFEQGYAAGYKKGYDQGRADGTNHGIKIGENLSPPISILVDFHDAEMPEELKEKISILVSNYYASIKRHEENEMKDKMSAEMLREYENGMSLQYIAEKYGCSKSSATWQIEKAKILKELSAFPIGTTVKFIGWDNIDTKRVMEGIVLGYVPSVGALKVIVEGEKRNVCPREITEVVK